MNVFVLTTGRTGSLSLERACSHISNYTAAHESRCGELGAERLNFPENHIEIDNRLAWFLGDLEARYGDNAIYIHLIRDEKKVADSYAKRWNRETSIVRAYAYGIIKLQEHQIKNPTEICLDFVQTTNRNIAQFISDKSKKMTFDISNNAEDFRKFWDLINAQGDYDKAFEELNAVHNAFGSDKHLNSFWNKSLRIIKKLPSFLKNA